MQAESLNCPNCGAAAPANSTSCEFCKSRLATVACPSCFGMMFLGSKHCSHCGARVDRQVITGAEASHCPHCSTSMKLVAVGSSQLEECIDCGGIWVDVEAFEKICADREEQSAVLGAATPAPKRAVTEQGKVRYVPCPRCGQLMNRINFARCSGVIVDVCKGHGTWFDQDELRGIIEFIKKGGLEAARNREKAQLEEERRTLAQEKLVATIGNRANDFDDSDPRSGAVIAARGLLKFLLG